jgi:N-acetylglucosaminyl-diphospho-decaprenol L-rhamnosyltransferase
MTDDRQRPEGSIAVVTVTRDSGRVLPGLLESVERHLPHARVVVVDCASSDDSVSIASRAGAEVMALEQNLGFGRGCNRGLQEVDEPVTALLNPDVELLDASLSALVSEAVWHDRLLAPLVLSPDCSRQDTVHPRPGSAPDLLRSVLPRAIPYLAPWRSRSPRRVGWAVGCAIVARTSTLRSLGPFDEGIFMYGEDLDLGLRAAQRGVETWFWPAGRVLHLQAHASEREFGGEPFELHARARHEVVSRRLGARTARVDDAAQAVTFASRILARRLLGRDAARERSQLRALRRVSRAS